jgi:hypothetical protein
MKLDNGMDYFDPVLDANNAYADGDHIGTSLAVSEITNVLHDCDAMHFIESLTVEDALKVHGKFNVLFFSAAPTVTSNNNAALAISAAEMKAKFIGHVAIVDTDYVDLSVGSYATIRNVGLPLWNSTRTGVQANPKLSIWAILQSKGSTTWTGASNLRVKFSTIRSR